MKAQEFAPDHAEWWHYYDFWLGPTGMFSLNHSSVVGDTIIQGKSSKRIKQDLFTLSENWDAHTSNIDTSFARDLFVYDAVDTVFIFNENFDRFTPLFVFNVNEGDTVCLPVIPDLGNNSDLRPNPIANGDTCFCFQIDSIRTVLYDTTYLKTFFQHALTDSNQFDAWPVYNWAYSSSGGYSFGSYARKIGGNFGGLLPQKINNGIAKLLEDTLVFNSNYELKCYRDDSLTISRSDSHGNSCFFKEPTHISSVTPKMDQLQIFPNPTHGQLNVISNSLFDKNAKVFILDITGRVILQKEPPFGQKYLQLNLKDLKPGIYLLKYENEIGQQFKKIVLQN